MLSKPAITSIKIDEIQFDDVLSVNEINRITSFLTSQAHKQINMDVITQLYTKKLVSSYADVTAVTCLIR